MRACYLTTLAKRDRHTVRAYTMPPRKRSRASSQATGDPPAPAPAPAPAPDDEMGSLAGITSIPIIGSPEAELLLPGNKRRTRAAARACSSMKPAFTAGLDETGKFNEWFTTYGLDSYPDFRG